MFDKAVVVVLIILLIFIVCTKVFKKCKCETTESYAESPTINQSIVDVNRSRMKDRTGMSVNDYLLEANLTKNIPVSENYRFL